MSIVCGPEAFLGHPEDPDDVCTWAADGSTCPNCGSEETVEAAPDHAAICTSCGHDYMALCPLRGC